MFNSRIPKSSILIFLIVSLIANFAIAADDVVGEGVGRSIMDMRRGQEPNTAPTEGKTETAKETPKPIEPEITVTPTEVNKVEPPKILDPNKPAEVVKDIKPVIAAVSDRLLNTIPAGCLFAVRINKFDTSMGKIDEYLAGLSPMPMTMMFRGQLGMIFGDPQLQEIDTQGSFAIFGFMPSNGFEPAIAALVPVKSYKRLLSVNTNIGPPDKDKISTLTAPGSMMPPLSITSAGSDRFALITLANNAPQLAVIKNSLKDFGSLAKKLRPHDINKAANATIWAYGDAAGAAELFESTIGMQLDQARNMGGKSQIAIMAMIAENLIETTEDLDSATLAIKIQQSRANLDLRISAVPGTVIAKTLTSASKTNTAYELESYLSDDAIMNFVTKINKSLLRKSSEAAIDIAEDIIAGMQTNGQSHTPATETTQLINDIKLLLMQAINSYGDEMMVSLKPGQGMPPISSTSITQITDKETMTKVNDQIYTLLEKFGIGSIEVKRGIETYKDIEIDSINIPMPMPNNGSQSASTRTAFIDGMELEVFGVNADKDIKRLINQVKLDGDGKYNHRIDKAKTSLKNYKQSSFFGTVNAVQYMKMVIAMLSGMGRNVNTDDLTSTADVAFCGQIADGGIEIEIAVPKKVLTETKNAGESLGRQMRGGGGMGMNNQPQPMRQPRRGRRPRTARTEAVPAR